METRVTELIGIFSGNCQLAKLGVPAACLRADAIVAVAVLWDIIIRHIKHIMTSEPFISSSHISLEYNS